MTSSGPMTDRAAFYGLTENKIEPVTEKGDVAIIAGKAFPVAVAAKRKLLEERIKRQGFDQMMEAMAYTWFNRLVAIRFMELHGYLDHGYRVLEPSRRARPRPRSSNTPNTSICRASTRARSSNSSWTAPRRPSFTGCC